MSGDNEPIVITPRMQEDIWDCGVACLEMLLGEPYAAIRALIRAKRPTGLSTRQLKTIAKKLGKPLVFNQEVREDDVGILDLERLEDEADPDGAWEGHFAIYAHGTVYNPAQGKWWMDDDAFLKHHRWKVVGILRRK